MNDLVRTSLPLAKKRNKGTINSWSVLVWNDSLVVVGQIGKAYIRTSQIVVLDLRNMLVETVNSVYSLGEPHSASFKKADITLVKG